MPTKLIHTSDVNFKQLWYKMFQDNRPDKKKRTNKKHRYNHINDLYGIIKNNDNIFILSTDTGINFNKYKNNNSKEYTSLCKILNRNDYLEEICTFEFRYTDLENDIKKGLKTIDSYIIILGADTYTIHKNEKEHILYYIMHPHLDNNLKSYIRKKKLNLFI